MNDVLVTIRLPPSLLAEVKELTKEQHFVDKSEFIRTVLRQRYEKTTKDTTSKISSEIINDIKSATISKSEMLLREELRKIQERLREELK